MAKSVPTNEENQEYDLNRDGQVTEDEVIAGYTEASGGTPGGLDIMGDLFGSGGPIAGLGQAAASTVEHFASGGKGAEDEWYNTLNNVLGDMGLGSTREEQAQIVVQQMQDGQIGPASATTTQAQAARDGGGVTIPSTPVDPGDNPLLGYDDLWDAGQITAEYYDAEGNLVDNALEAEHTKYLLNGEPFQAYEETDARKALQNMSNEELAAWRKKAWLGGQYGSDGKPASWVGTMNTDDIEIMEMMMEDAAVGNLTWEDYLSEASSMGEKYGRPTTNDELMKINNDSLGQLAKFEAENGLELSQGFKDRFQANVLDGTTSAAKEMMKLRKNVLAPQYSAYAEEILDGANVSDFAVPYVSAAENLLEEGYVGLNDPQVQRALQGEGRVPLWKFKEDLKADDRWQYTENAYQEMDQLASGIRREMGL